MSYTQAFFFGAGFSITLAVGVFVKMAYISVIPEDIILVGWTLLAIITTLFCAKGALREHNIR